MRILTLLISLSILLSPSLCDAAEGCTLVVTYPGMKVLQEDGDCAQHQSPASSFKIPMAVMGFEAGILVDSRTPALDYKDIYNSDMEVQKKNN